MVNARIMESSVDTKALSLTCIGRETPVFFSRHLQICTSRVGILRLAYGYGDMLDTKKSSTLWTSVGEARSFS